jgi:hypothetical protein
MRLRQQVALLKKRAGCSPAPLLLSTVAPVAIAVTSPVVVTMAMRLADANGDAWFAAIDADATSAAHAVTISCVAMPSTAAGTAGTMAAMDELDAAVGCLIYGRRRKRGSIGRGHAQHERRRE